MFTKCPWHLAGADESLEIGSPMIPSDKLQEVQLPLTRPALPELLYGFRGRSQPKSRELIRFQLERSSCHLEIVRQCSSYDWTKLGFKQLKR